MSGSGWDFSKYVDPAPEQGSGPPPTSSSGYERASASPTAYEHSEQQFPGATDFGFGEGVAPVGMDDRGEVGRPPVIWLAACALAAVAGGILAGLLGVVPVWSIIAWCICGPIAIGLLAAFSAADTRQRARSIYSRASWVKPAYIACLVLCGIAVCASALRIALWVGRL